ncbi:non-ribosomal peptide synthetase [Chitinophaga sp. HK235]|uniref:non-ribosomal peptide synthetase n=1 Tax=Chitinophaga sp. HK235 TaxID=2952571 RepID=UPI001BA8668D|nr:non-ribosomal peptide synthetase [Chitinophaga sp. HK235]
MSDRKLIDIIALLEKASENGVKISLHEDELVVKVREERSIDGALLSELKQNKAHLITYLQREKQNRSAITGGNKITPAARTASTRIPLSYSQERLWFIDQLQGSTQYHIPAVLQLKGTLDRTALSRTLQTIVNRHEVLRTVIEQSEGIACQRMLDKDQWQLTIVDDARCKADTAALQEHIKALIDTPFNLSADHMLRAHLIPQDSETHILVVTMHHIASDAWSSGIIVRELALLYNAYAKGEAPELSPLPVQYADYSIWQRNDLSEEKLAKKLDYWKEKLSDNTPLQLPIADRASTAQSANGAGVSFTLPGYIADQLQKLSRQQDTTLFMTMLTAVQVLLYRCSGQTDISTGYSLSGRRQQELEDLIGFFLNTLVLRSDLSKHPTFISLLQQVKASTVEAYEYQDTPFGKIVEAVVKDRDSHQNPLFQVMFVMQHAPALKVIRLGEVDLTVLPFDRVAARFDLTFFVTENEDGLHVDIIYRSDLFRAEAIVGMAKHFEQLLLSVVENPLAEISLLPMLSAAEASRLMEVSGNGVAVPRAAAGDNMADLFSAQAARTPSATALVFESSTLSYQELEERSNQLAHHLRHLGVKTGTLVPLCIERSPEMMVALLGILKAGGAYVPVDPDYPQRIGYVLSDTAASAVVSSNACRGLVETSAVDHIIALDGDIDILRRYPVKAMASTVRASDLAYVIYTSGSTGNPKGVMITHGNLLDYLSGLKAALPVSDCHSFALLPGISTDLGNTILYHALTSGGSLHLFTREMINDSEKLQTYFSSHSIDCLKIVPSHWKALSSGDLLLPARLLIFGGEVLDADVVTRIFSSGSSCVVVNHYGPTETTIGKLLHIVERDRVYDQHIPIGKPFSNSRVYVLSDRLQLCPAGIPGELFIGGDGVGAGYLNNAALTSERFITDPFSDNGRLYRTGDIVKYLPDGNIMFLGRRDDQLKIRGYRVELEEIARVLEGAPGVLQGVVVCHGEDGGLQRLTGYLVTAADYSRSTVDAYLQEHLPDYMIPSELVVLDKFPLLSNGKIDRKSLPDPVREVRESDDVASENVAEELLSNIWCSLLELDHVGRLDNFFALGGHSLLAIRLVSAIRKSMEVEVSIGDIFDYPTIASLSAHLSQTSGRPVLPGIKRYDPRPAQIPLSYSQERLWFIDQLAGSVQYHVPHVLRLTGQLNREALTHALQEIVNRHEILRTVIVEQDGQPSQQVLARNQWQLVTVTDTLFKDGSPELKEYITGLIQLPFNLSEDHMLRAHLIPLTEAEHLLILMAHHMASDEWSQDILVREVVKLYTAYITGHVVQLPVLPVQYADYALWQQECLSGAMAAQQLAYWKQQLEGAAVLSLPVDYTRPAMQSICGGLVSCRIDPAVTLQLQQLSREHHATLYMTILAAFKVLLYRYSGQTDICVGSPVSGRILQELEELIGFFVNTLVLRNDLSNNPSFTTLLQQVRTTTLNAYAHQEVPFAKIVEAVVKQREVGLNPLFQVMFVWKKNNALSEVRLPDIQLSADPLLYSTSKFDMTFFVAEEQDGLEVSVEYSKDLFKEDTIVRLLTHFEQLLCSIAASPADNIDTLQMLNEREEQQLLKTFNATTVSYPDTTITDLFAKQAALTPAAAAVVFEDETLSYEALDTRASHLANFLRSKGVGADTLVPLCIERSLNMVVAILGILKAGGAYVPIDPEYPAARIQYMIADTRSKILLTSHACREKVNMYPDLELIVIDSDWEQLAAALKYDPPAATAATSLAYVLYTSGTTGQPKGVEMTAGALLNLLLWQKGELGDISGKRVLQFASLNFDASFQEIFLPLCFGGTVYLIEEGKRRDMSEMLGLIEQYHINYLFLPYVVLKNLCEYVKAATIYPRSLEGIFTAGEQLRLSEDIRELMDRADARLYNYYGPTEAHVVSAYEIVASDYEERLLPPIGKPISNTQLYILDAQKRLCGIGIAGELYIGGVQVARGYLNRPNGTLEKFLPDPFSTLPDARLYKTGDIARWLADGNIEYLGRADDQVKIRGYRIELGEVESALQQCELVRQVVVVVRGDNHAGHKQLVAYIVPAGDFDRKGIMDYLRNKLPEYMIPGILIALDQLPLTANGKVNKQALPAPDSAALSAHEFVAPRTATESTLADIWTGLLGISQIGIYDNFFELGGHSLMALRLIAAIRKTFDIKISVKLFFQLATIEAMARHISAIQHAAAVTPKNVKTIKL